jgi:hypothetical protein
MLCPLSSCSRRGGGVLSKQKQPTISKHVSFDCWMIYERVLWFVCLRHVLLRSMLIATVDPAELTDARGVDFDLAAVLGSMRNLDLSTVGSLELPSLKVASLTSATKLFRSLSCRMVLHMCLFVIVCVSVCVCAVVCLFLCVRVCACPCPCACACLRACVCRCVCVCVCACLRVRCCTLVC